MYGRKKKFRKSIQIKNEIKDYISLSSSFNSLGCFFLYVPEYSNHDSARHYFYKAIKTATPYKDLYNLLFSFEKLGFIHTQEKEYDLAIKYYEKGLEAAHKMGGFNGKVNILIHLLDLNMKVKDWKKSDGYAKQLVPIAPKIQNIETKKAVYEVLSRYAQNHQTPELALEYFKIYKELSDEIADDHNKTLQDLKVKYEQEKNAREMAEKNLVLFNLEREKRRLGYLAVGSVVALLLGSLVWFYRNKLKHHRRMEALKEQIAANLHDDTSNRINGISRIAEIMQKSEMSKQEQEQELSRISRLSKDALSNMSDIIWSLNEKEASVGSLLDKTKDFVADTLLPLNIPFELTIFPESIAMQKIDGEARHQLLMVFKETISNSIKHTYPEQIKLTIKQQSGKYYIKIGNWFKRKRIAKFSQGNGLLNIERRIHALNGEVAFQQEADCFIIDISFDC